MGVVFLVLATLVGLSHLALVVVLVVGGPIALRYRRFAQVHIPALIATAAVFAVGADCPLTSWQKYFLRRGGERPYRGGFIEHYLVNPVTGGGITPVVRLVVLLAWVVPTVISYGVLVRRAHPAEYRR